MVGGSEISWFMSPKEPDFLSFFCAAFDSSLRTFLLGGCWRMPVQFSA